MTAKPASMPLEIDEGTFIKINIPSEVTLHGFREATCAEAQAHEVIETCIQSDILAALTSALRFITDPNYSAC